MDEMLRSLSSEEMEVEIESETQGRNNRRKGVESESGTEERNKGGAAAAAGGLVKWEKFLPKMVLRVLLVEADDSTRQIITALLRKCSYRVAAVPDGLKAWEILKGKPNQIDLILTEVDLPSISGFALLTLIMEHEICKNIPVIMMSSQDSVSTVYKCMLRGAADYLVKPIRRNELRNLWQHVWRKQSSAAGGNGPQDESDARQKVEATAENNATSNHSSGFVACVQRNKECIEKGSDAQSSCTKPDFEAESACMENMLDFSQPILGNSFPSDLKRQNQEAYINLGQKLLMHENEARGPQLGAFGDANTTTQGTDVKPENWRRDVNIAGEACDNNDVLINSSREAIDFIGAFNDYPNYSYRNIISKFDSSPQLDLSLRRSHPGGFDNEVTEERHTLRHSDASAFTRYINRPMQPPQETLCGDCDQEKEHGSNSEKFLSNFCTGHNFDASSPSLGTQKSVISLAADQSKQSEVATSCTQQRVFPVSVPVRGIRFDNLCTGYGSVHSPIFCPQSGTSSLLSPSSASQQESSFRVNQFHQTKFENSNCEQLCETILQNANNSTNQTGHKLEHKLDSLGDRGHVSAATDQSASSSLCNGGVSNLSSIGYGSFCGSNGNIDQAATVNDATEGKNEENLLTNDGNSQRSIQREAALMKFRLKRKDRCYEKKVRYESRKKLAEQRPRVKGQFVRQVQLDHPPAETVNHHGNSYDD